MLNSPIGCRTRGTGFAWQFLWTIRVLCACRRIAYPILSARRRAARAIQRRYLNRLFRCRTYRAACEQQNPNTSYRSPPVTHNSLLLNRQKISMWSHDKLRSIQSFVCTLPRSLSSLPQTGERLSSAQRTRNQNLQTVKGTRPEAGCVAMATHLSGRPTTSTISPISNPSYGFTNSVTIWDFVIGRETRKHKR